MQFQILSKIAKNKISWLLFVVLLGIASGKLIIQLFSSLPSTYATFCLAAITFPFVVIIVGDSKRLLLAILLICLPITVDITLNYVWHMGGACGFVISLYDMILAALYLIWFIEIISKKTKIKLYPEISLPAIFLIGFACLSILAAKHPMFSLYEVIEVAKMPLTFIYLANNIKTKNDVKFVIFILMVCLFYGGMLGWAQHRYDEPFFPTALGGPSWIDSRVKGTWRSPNDFGWYLTFLLPLAMSLTVSEIKPFYRKMCFLTLSVGTASLMWTSSRASWISFGVAAIFVCIISFFKIKGKNSLINIFFTVIAILILLIPLYPRLYNKMFFRFSGNDRGSAYSRLPQFKIAIDIIKDHPFLGVGINNYSDFMWDYDNSDEGLGEHTHYFVHNIFLHIAAEMGIPGIFSFLWFLSAIFYSGLRYVILNNNFMVHVVIGLLGGILAFSVHGLYDAESIGGKLFLFNWFFAGVIFAIRGIKPQEQ